MRKYLTIVLGLFLVAVAKSQTIGDEDGEMLNQARSRDQRAIDEAVDGWWTKSMRLHNERIQWWRDARFGMFMHWGVYSLPAGEWKSKKVSGYAEHLMRKEKISREEYLQLAHQFNPVNFNADRWVKDAIRAGMRYFIITAKHHDGFALFDSKFSDFDIVQQTPFKRDPMQELAIACRKHGMKFGFYYSHAFDWEHPTAPGNDWEYQNPGGDLNLYGGRNWYDLHPGLLEKAKLYVNEKAIPQIKELLVKYHPDILWFDTPHKLPLSENIRILKAIRETDPNVVINGRLVRSSTANFGDYKNTADRPAEFFPVEGDWEAIPTTNESYGYHKFDNSHKSASFFIQLLAKAASRGGNLLMNIGPRGDGTFDPKDLEILYGIGNWMEKNKQSIYSTSKSSIPLQNWGVSTTKGDNIYLHVFQWPTDGKLFVGGLRTPVQKAFYLAQPTKQIKLLKAKSNDYFLSVGDRAPDSINTVIVLQLKNKPASDSTFFLSANIPVTRFLAFDAAQHGKGFSYGDGKADRFYVEGWKNMDQYLSWKFRSNESTNFKVIIKYVLPENAGGEYLIGLDTLKITRKTQAGKNEKVISDEIGTIKLGAGSHQLSIKPTLIKNELMKLLEIELIKTDL